MEKPFLTRTLTITNIVLVLTAFLLILCFSGIKIPNLGKVWYWWDQKEPLCLTGFKKQFSLINLEKCCRGIQQQLKCEDWNKKIVSEGKTFEVNKKCFTGEEGLFFLVNNKAYAYCWKEGFLPPE